MLFERTSPLRCPRVIIALVEAQLTAGLFAGYCFAAHYSHPHSNRTLQDKADLAVWAQRFKIEDRFAFTDFKLIVMLHQRIFVASDIHVD